MACNYNSCIVNNINNKILMKKRTIGIGCDYGKLY